MLAAIAGLLPVTARPEPLPLRWDPARDAGVTAAASLLALALTAPQVTPRACRFCGSNAFDARLRSRLLWSDPAAARTISDVLANGVLPAAVIAHAVLAARSEGSPPEAAADVLVIAQAAAIAASLDELAKDSVARRRPGGAGNTSFYSGHTSLAFSLASAAGTVSSLRGYRSAPWVWAGGMTLAAAVGYLRVAGDAHWATDVLAGAAAGGLVGFAVPWLFHRSLPGAARPRLDVVPAPGGVAVVF